jgi:predicted acyl esterase
MSRPLIRITLATLGLAAATLPMTSAHAAPPPGYTVTKDQHLTVKVGPNGDQPCDVAYDLYVPKAASSSNPVPAILTTNGFGGSKADQAGEANLFANHGYEVLSYSGLGFGGSTCPIETDSPEWDGKAASQLITLLGKRAEVLKDDPATNDPRVGLWGGSYGGGFQFAAASVDPRIDAMIPIITWNDLAYSLGPNNDAANFHYAASPPGVLKFEWSDLFYADGHAQVASNPGKSGWIGSTPPNPACPGFNQTVCVINAESTASGYPTKDTVDYLRHASAQYELFEKPGTHIPPTMLVQGETDSLFTIADATANYRALRAHGVDAKLVLQLGGHSGSAAPGELNNDDPSKGYESQLFLNWYDHYLKRDGTPTGPAFEYFRDWVTYDQNGSAQPAYGASSVYPLPGSETFYLSGDKSLVESADKVQSGTAMFVNPAGGLPASYSETSAVQNMQPFNGIKPSDPPGEFAAFTTAPLDRNIDNVGIPTLDATITTALPSADPSTELVLFGKLYDVAPDGSVELVHRLVSPVRVADTQKQVHINLPGIVHRFQKGHSIQLVLASTDQAYVGSRLANVITVTLDKSHPSTLRLPVVANRSARVAAASASGPGSVPAPGEAAAPLTGVPDTAAAAPAPLPTAAALITVITLALGVQRRRRRGTR